MPKPTCNHVHANGALCKSPPLRHRDYCHFHLDQIGRQLRAARARARYQPASLRVPLLEDPFAVQVTLIQIADAITHNEIDVQRGRLLMSVLRLASRNLKQVRDWKQEPLFAAEAGTESAVSEWPSFEQENQLPPGFDLNVDPEMAFPSPQNSSVASGAPSVPAAGMYGSDGIPPNPTAGFNGARATDSALLAQIRQALGEAEAPFHGVTADQLELMDIYEREGQQAAFKFSAQMVRNDRRRERQLQRAHYEELARHHNIKIAARKLVEEQQSQAHAAARVDDSRTRVVEQGGNGAGVALRKKPGSEVVSDTPRAGSHTA